MKAPETVLITGAEGALGREVVRAFLHNGVKKIYATHLKPLAAATEDAVSPHGNQSVEWIQADVTNTASVKSAISGLAADALVHCAGGFRYSNIESVSDEDLDLLLNLNLRSAFLLARALVPGMKTRGFGRIVFISAKATLSPGVGMGPYTASKIGLNALTQSLAEELKGFDINVNAVLPSILDTGANRKDMPDADFTKWVTPQALARIIVSLTGADHQAIHGALIPISGRV